MTRNKQWAVRAHEHVAGWRNNSAAGKLKTWCLKAPSLLQHSGTVQTLAFLRSRAADATMFCDALANTLDGRRDGRALFHAAQQAPLPEYLALSRDLIEVATWFRRFAQIELKDVQEIEER